MDNVMDLSAFQIVEAMNDMDMIRITNERQQQQQQHQQSGQSTKQNQLHQNIQHDIDILLNQSNTNSYIAYTNETNNNTQIANSPHYRTTPSSLSKSENYEQQEDIFTPLISPAITPSFSYRAQQHTKEVEFPPLSSPAILPQRDQQTQKRSTFHQGQMADTSSNDNADYQTLSANEIREQYEQLEHAKMLITQKLSELQKSKSQYQQSVQYYGSSSANHDNLNGILSQSQQQGNIAANNNLNSLSKGASPCQSPHIEPATPASLMNMKIASSSSAKLHFPTSSVISNSSIYKPSYHSSSPSSFMDSPVVTPSMSTSMTLPSPLALQPRNPKPTKEKPVRAKKARRETIDSKTGMHSSPRALKPLLISPTLHPGKPSVSGVVNTVEDAEHILATRSNYQNLMEGKGAALGIAFDTQIKSGLEVRRTAHKAAEQKRRDSLKEWFDRLRREVEEGYVKRQKSLMSEIMEAQELEKDDEDTQDRASGNMKPLSKVLLLQYAYEYISSLKTTLEERERTIKELTEGSKEEKRLKRKQADRNAIDEEQEFTDEGQI